MRTKAKFAVRVVAPIESKAKLEDAVAEEDDDTPVPSIAQEEAEGALSEEERALQVQIAALKASRIAKGTGATRGIRPPREKPLRVNQIPDERVWINDIAPIFRSRGFLVDEYHTDFRLDITSLNSDWRVCIIELLGDKFTMAVYFDFTVGYATRKVASIEYIEDQDKVGAVEWLIDSMKRFSHRTMPGQGKLKTAPQYIEEDEVMEE